MKSDIYITFIEINFNIIGIMLLYRKIINEIKLKKMSQSDLAEKIGMTREGFSRMIKAKTMKVETLEIIASILGQPESFFFKTEYPTNSETSTMKEPNPYKTENMVNLIESQKKIIALLEDKVNYLEQRLLEYEESDKSKEAV